MLKIVLDAFADVVATVIAQDVARMKRLENAWSEANMKLPPIIDRLGRMHAPVDGYMLPNMHVDYIGNYDERIFAAGQFLPIPLSGDDFLDSARFRRSDALATKYLPRDKIKVDESLANEIISELKDNSYIGFTKGKSWDVNGKSVCYLYMTAGRDSVLNLFVKAVKEAIENTDKQEFTGNAIVGRVRVKGTILKVSDVLTVGYRGQEMHSRKLYIRLDNDSTCYGSESTALCVKSGDVVEFTATFQIADGSTHHSYYKRPHNMVIIETNGE